MYMDEIWLPIADDENYEVSNYGNVRSIKKVIISEFKNRFGNVVKRTATYKSRLKKISVGSAGYYQTSIYVNSSIKKTVNVHRLVAEAFIPNPENKATVNHKDGNKANNNVFNLEWSTQKENNEHAFRTGLKKALKGDDNKLSKPVIQLDKAGNVLNRFPSMNDAQIKTGIAGTNISECCRHRSQKTAGGYIWKFDDKL